MVQESPALLQHGCNTGGVALSYHGALPLKNGFGEWSSEEVVVTIGDWLVNPCLVVIWVG